MANDKTGKSDHHRKSRLKESLHKPERVLALSDGVVAIAITVLVLPLADIEIPESVLDSGSVTTYIWDTYSQLLISFVISWLVIIAYWFDHHRLFNKFKYVDDFTIRVNMIWLFAIVVMPFPTNLLSQGNAGPSGQAVSLYLFVLFATNLALFIIEYHADKHPEIRDSSHLWYSKSWAYGLVAACYILILACVAPFLGGATLWGLIGLFLIGSLTRLGNLGVEPVSVNSEAKDEAKAD